MFLLAQCRIFICILCLWIIYGEALKINLTAHQRRLRKDENNYLKKQRAIPVKITHYKSYPQPADNDEYMTAYENDYGTGISNFTGPLYDNEDSAPLYPNPDIVENRASVKKPKAFEVEPIEVEIPDNSLADADLKDHNIIDSITYLYGFTSNAGAKNEWILLIYVSRALACVLVIGTAVYVLWSDAAKEFRASSELYPVNINLLCSLAVCNLIYMEAILGVSESRCEMVALLLHYAHLVCAAWLLALCWTVASHCVRGSAPPLKYHYLFAYGIPAILVLFNCALSVEEYETRRYCWMSLEKGMVLGCMLPAMLLIVLTTIAVLLALPTLNTRRSRSGADCIQELINQYAANGTASTDSLSNGAPASRRNTDSEDNLERDDEQAGAVFSRREGCAGRSTSQEATEQYLKLQIMRFDLLNLSFDNLSWRSDAAELNGLKVYLTFCLVMQPFYAIVWVMGVVALENSNHWLTPAIFLVLCTSMYVYIAVHMCTQLLTLKQDEADAAPCCERTDCQTPAARSTDSIPLLDTNSPQQVVTVAAVGDTISTISI